MLLLEGTALEALGFLRQASHRFHELVRLSPRHVDGRVALGTALVSLGASAEGVRHLIEAAVLTRDPHLVEAIAGYLADGLGGGRRTVHLPAAPAE